MTKLFAAWLLLTAFVAIPVATAAHADGDSVDEIHYSFGNSPDSVVFDWHGAEQDIYYGLDASYGQLAVAGNPPFTPVDEAGPFREVTLTGLQPATTYHYKIGATGLDHTFQTVPTGDFKWVDVGDTGSTLCTPWLAQTHSLIAAQQPNFVTHGGDISYANDCGVGAVHQYFVDQQVWSESAAFQPAWGNHEYGSPGTSEGMTAPPGTPRDSMLNYKGRVRLTNAQTVTDDTPKQINNPGCGWETGSTTNTCQGDDWGWFQAGGVLFISYPEPWYNAYAGWETLASQLMASAQANPAIDFIVTYGHRPGYSSVSSQVSTALQSALNQLAGTYSPSASNPNGKYVLNVAHHVHNLEVFSPINGLVNVVNGGGGVDQAGFGSVAPNSIFRDNHPGILSANYSASQHSLTFSLLCGPDYPPNPVNPCTYGSTLYSQTFTRPDSPPAAPTITTTLTASSNTAVVGQDVTYTATIQDPVANTTVPGASAGISVPTNMAIVSAAGANVSGTTATWPAADLNGGPPSTVQLTAQLTSGQPGDTAVATATVSTADSTCTTADSACSASAVITVIAAAPPTMQTTLTGSATAVQLGQQVTYTADTQNTAVGSVAAGTSLSITVPSTMSVVDAPGASVNGTTATWPATDLGGGSDFGEVQLVAQLDSGNAGDADVATATTTTTDTSCADPGSSCTASVSITVAPSVVQWITNQSVETDMTGWTGTYGSSRYVNISRSAEAAHSGSYSLKVSGLSGAKNLQGGFNDNPRWVTNTTAGTTYTQSAWVDPAFVGQKICLRLREWSGSKLMTDKLVTLTAVTTGWQELTQTLTAAGTNDQLSFALYGILSANQSFYADDFSLTTPAG